MLRKSLSQPAFVTTILILQFIPLLLFPIEVFDPASQQWWLPVLLTFLALIAVIKITVQRTTDIWPWYLISFSQGFNIISRLMMLMPHATKNVDGVQVVDLAYVTTSILAIIISAGYIFYSELPDVRMSMLSYKKTA